MYIFLAMAGIIFLFLDLVKTSVLRLSFSAAFLFAAICAYKLPENYTAQFGTFSAFFLIFYSLIKTILKKELRELEKKKNLKEYIGKTAIVKKDLGKTLSVDGIGQIEFNNQLWSAKSVDDKEIKAGAEVEIVSKENMIMNVKAKTDGAKS